VDGALSPARPPSDAEFALFQALIEREAGIYLSDCKKALLSSRLMHRLRDLRLAGFGAYYRHVVHHDRDELVRLVDAICTNETHFFREPHHFAHLSRTVFPDWVARARAGQRERKVRIWSAGCSSGEEPYSLAMLALDQLPASEGWQVEIHATDLSTRILAAAQAAIYKNERLAEIPFGFRRFLLRGTGSQAGVFKVGPEVRELVRFRQLNLIEDHLDVPDGLDLVLCRNVLIYFRAETRDRTVRRLADKLAIGGQLFLGHAESLQQHRLPLRVIMPTVYQRIAARGPR
jgi:chemotaxis protein methyltransferase CheR